MSQRHVQICYIRDRKNVTEGIRPNQPAPSQYVQTESKQAPHPRNDAKRPRHFRLRPFRLRPVRVAVVLLLATRRGDISRRLVQVAKLDDFRLRRQALDACGPRPRRRCRGRPARSLAAGGSPARYVGRREALPLGTMAEEVAPALLAL